MKVLIVGLGSIAWKHIHVLKELVPKTEIYALRSSSNAHKHEGVINLFGWDSVKDHNFRFGIIASPSSVHLEHIKALNDLNIPLFIEKPLVISYEQIKEFGKIRFKNDIQYVACNLRFHPLIEFIKQYLGKYPSQIHEVNSYFGSYLPNWRPNRDYTKIYSASKELGGGVHLDLIHEPDYIVYLFGLPLSTIKHHRKVSNLDIDSYDSSVSLFQYKDFQAQIVLNYFRKDSKRTLEIIRQKNTLMLDFVKNEIYDLTDGTSL